MTKDGLTMLAQSFRGSNVMAVMADYLSASNLMAAHVASSDEQNWLENLQALIALEVASQVRAQLESQIQPPLSLH